jgi:TP901 family phage tail tape measure protein
MADNIITTNITAHADFTSLRAQLAAVTAQLIKLQETTAGTNAKLANQIAVMNKSFATTLTSTGQFSQHFVSLSSDVDKFGKNLDRGRLKLNDYYNAWSGHTKKTSNLIRDLAKQQVMLQQAIVQPVGKNAQGQMQYNVMVAKGLDEIKNKMAIARQEAAIMNKVMLDGSTGLINWGKNTQWAGRQLTVGLTVPLVMFGAAAQKAFREADAELVRLTKVYGGLAATSSADLAQVRKDVTATAREIAGSYGVAYKETIALAADLAATGQQGNELIAATQQTTRLAVLGEVDRQDAMKATLAIQNAFKQNTDELAQSIDFLNAVENQTSTSLADLTEAIPKAGPVIKSLGGDVKDLALYLTAMKEGGVNASEGANAIKSAMASLINPTKVATEQFAGFGIDLKGIVNSNAGDLTATILELQGALDKLNPLDKSRAIEQLFGKFQFARMSALFENLGKSGSQTLQVMDLMKASVTDLAAISDRELKMMTESASGQFKRAWAAVQADLAAAGEQFLRVSTMVLKVVDSIIRFFQKLPEPVKTLLNVLGGFTAIAGPLIMLAGVMGNFIGYVIKGIFHLRQLAKGGQGFKLLTPEIIAADAAAKGLATSFYSDTEATIVLSNAVNTLAESFKNLELKANAAKVSVQPAVSTVAGGVIMAAGPAGRMVDKDSPLVGKPYSRDMSHLIPSGNPQDGTIFGTVPGAKPVNIRVGRNPQAYMDADLPKIPGLTSIGGTSTGIVAAEAAKWHAMTAAISMQSEAELKVLKAEVMATGTVTSSLSDSYRALLPEFTQITELAAKETAAIVQQVQASKITVEQARARIISLNATVEAMLAETTRLTAAGMGRTANLTTVPLTSQPVVDPATGKSNMKEMFHKGPTKAMVDRIARALGGVRTSGAGYNIETTKPKFAKGGFVPGTGDTDTYHTTAEPGSFVINKAATERHLPLITNILGGKSYYAQEGGQVPVVLTPGEAVIPASFAKRNMPLMYELNGGPGNTSGSGMHEFGGETAFERSHVSEASAADLKRVRATRGYANSVSVGRGIPIWMSRDANQETRSVGKGMTGPQLAKEFRKAIAAGRHPFEPWMTAAQGLGGDPRNNAQFNKVFNEMLKNLEKDTRVFGGKNGVMTFEKWFEKEVIGSKSFKNIRVGDRSFRSIFNSVLQPMGPRDGKPIAALETLVKSRTGLTTIENSKLAGLAKGMLGTFSGSSFNSSRQRLAIMMSRAFLKRNAGGSIPGGTVEKGRYGYGKPFFIGMPRTIKQVEEQRAKRVAMEKANQAVTDSRFAKTPVTQYGELLSPTSGRSFPVPGVGGLYMKGDEKVFVKPVLDERAAVAEMRATQIAREVHGLHAPTQKVVVMRDPTDPTGRRKLLALESKFDPKVAATDAKFTTDEYFRQLVASALRGDKDLARGNLSGNVLSDVGPAGVFSAASGLRGYASVMPSVKDQAYINLLGKKGSGAKKFFAESTHQIPKGMTADEYHSRMLKEIESALPKLKQTVSRFDLNPEEKVVYEAMIKRLSDARGVNWKELHGIHSGLQMSPEKQMTPAAIAKMVAADELKRRQTGHSASLSDNAFKTDANGFRFGGLLEAITKGKAMHRIGAGFGKDSTGGWGVTSLQIGMAEKLFGSTGLTKRTQRILYDKFAASLAKEMPYGYAKNAQGHLIKAVEPDVMDSVIRSAASSTLSAPEGRKVLSAIDREILRKKFANWESKKDTPLTETLKQLVFGIEKREMGGPVNAGQPYIVGEKGPELFVPRNAGGIIPNGYKAGGPVNGFNLGGLIPMLKQLLLIMGISEGSKYAGEKIGGTPGNVLTTMGSFLPFLLMGQSMGGGGKGRISNMFPKATTPIGAVGVNKVTGVPQLTKYGTMLSKLTGSSNLLAKTLGMSLGIFTKFNLALGVTAYGVKFAYDKWQAHKEALRLNALGYGMTAEAAQKAGLKFTNFNDKIKEAINNAKALREKNTLLYESMKGSGTPLKITIEEYKKLKKEVKENYSDQVALINQTGDNAEDQKALAIRLKEQLVAMGMSAEDAAKKIYTMYAASDFAPNAAAYTIRSDGFNKIKDTASAASSAIDSLSLAMANNLDATEQANQLNTAMMALSTDVETRQAKALKEARKQANKDGTYLSTGDEKQLMLDQEQAAIDEINSKVESQVYLTKEVVDEMAKIDPAIRQIVNEQDTALSLWQKTRIQVKGYTGDLRSLNDQQTNDLYKLQIALGKSIEAANRAPGGALEKQYKALDANKKLQAAYEKAARGQSVAQQISDRDKINSIQKQIDANNKLTESRLKALDAAKQEGDIGREIAKKQAEYDAALATGNIAGAQQASLDIQGYQSELQYNSQKKSLEDSNILKNLPLQKLIEAIQGKQQGIADKAALAGEKLGDLSKTITDQESTISSVNTAMLNWEIELLKQPEAERAKWKASKQSETMLAAVADAAKAAGIKLNGLKDLDFAKGLVEGLDKKLGAVSSIGIDGNVTIVLANGQQLNIGGKGSGTKDAPYDLGKAGVGTNTISKTTLADWSGIGGFGALGTRQKVKGIAEERGILPGQFFSLTDADGKIFVYKMGDKGQITEITDPYKKADGGYIRGAGTATSDSIPAYLSNGEYVIKADSVAKYGVDHFDALNAGRFAAGGPVNPTAKSEHKSSFGNGSTTVNVNHQGGKLMGPIEAWQDANKQVIKIEVPPITANFATNSYTLNKEQRLELQAIAKDLIKHKLASIVVQGHTDSVGKGKDNKILSQNRANAIAEYISKFVPGTAFIPVGYGEYRPLVPNTTAENKAKNRRAELFLPDKYKTIYPEYKPEKHEYMLSKGRIEGGGEILDSNGKLMSTGTLTSGGSMESTINWGKLFKKIKSGLGFHTGGPVGHRHGRNLPKTKPSPSPSPTRGTSMSAEEYRKKMGMDPPNTVTPNGNTSGMQPGDKWNNRHLTESFIKQMLAGGSPAAPLLNLLPKNITNSMLDPAYSILGQPFEEIFAGSGTKGDWLNAGLTFVPFGKLGSLVKAVPKALKTIKQIPTAIKVGQKLKAGNFDDLINIGKSTAGKSRPSIMKAADGSVHYMKIMQDVMEGAFEVTGSTIAKRFKMPSTDNILGTWKNLSVILSKDFASKGMKTLEDAGAMLPHGALDMDWLKANASMKSFGKMRAVSSILGHGDMHPGNLLLKGKKTLGAFDWGMIDNLTNPAETALKAGSTLVGKQASQFTKGFASVRKSIAKQGPEKFIDDILTKSGITDEGQLKVLRIVLERNVKSLLDLKIPGKFHKGGAVGHKHLSAGHMASNYKAPYSGPSMSALSPAKAAANSKATDKFYEKNPDYYKDKNGEWVKRPPSLWETFTTAKNWPLAFGKGHNPSGPIYEEGRNILLTALAGHGAAERYNDGRDWAKGEYLSAAVNIALARVGGASGNALMRSLVEQFGIMKGIPNMGHLLPKGSIPFLGASGSKLTANLGTAAIIGGAKPFAESKFSTAFSDLRPKIKVTADETDRLARVVKEDWVEHEGRRVPTYTGGPFGTDTVVYQGRRDNFSELALSGRVNHVIPTTPEGILSYLIKQKPKDKKLIAMRDNFEAGNIGHSEIEFVKKMVASSAFGPKTFSMRTLVSELPKEYLDLIKSKDLPLGYQHAGQPVDQLPQETIEQLVALKQSIEERTLRLNELRAGLPKIKGSESSDLGLLPHTETKGLTTFISSMLGNKGAKALVDKKTKLYGPYLDKITKAYKTMFDESAAYRGTDADVDLSQIPMIRELNFGIKYDKNGNIVAPNAGMETKKNFDNGTLDDAFSRVTEHWSMFDSVRAGVQHMGSTWKDSEKTIVTTLENLLKTSEFESFASFDAWRTAPFGKPHTVLSKDASVITAFKSEKEYLQALKDKGLHQDGSSFKLVTENPETKEVFYLKKPQYTDSELDEIVNAFEAERYILPEVKKVAPENRDEWEIKRNAQVFETAGDKYNYPQRYDVDRLLKMLSIRKAQLQVGIDIPYAEMGEGANVTIKENLIKALENKTGTLNQGLHMGSGLANAEKFGDNTNPFLTLLQGHGTKSKEGALASILMHGYHGKFSSEAYPAHYNLSIKERTSKLIEEWARASVAYGHGDTKIKPMSLDSLQKLIQKITKEDKDRDRMASGGYVGKRYNIPKFESGINNVPANMLAMLHKNEAVVPANMNPFNPNANNATMGGGVYNITNNINGYDGNLEQLSSMVTQKTITAIKSLDSRNAKMAGPSFTVGAK